MHYPLIVLLVMTCATASTTACPASAPQDWHISGAKLANVRILAYLSGDHLDEQALPAAPPDMQWSRANQFFQAWDVHEGTVYQADCLYMNTDRFLRVDLRAGQRCVARWQMRHARVIEGTLRFTCGQ